MAEIVGGILAESAVSAVVDKLGNLLADEARMLSGVRGEVRFLKVELESMQGFLKDADEKGTKDNVVKAWVKEVRDLAYNVEDALDEFVQRLGAPQDQKPGFASFLIKVARFFKELKWRHQLGSQIKEIKEKVCEIKTRKDRYELNSNRSSGEGPSCGNEEVVSFDPRLASLYIEEDETVGIDEPREELIGWLLDERQPPNKRSTRQVHAVVGMGGLGKTTLVKKVYDDRRVKEHFHCHAWVTVSKSFRVQELLKSMIRQFCEGRREPIPEGIETLENIDQLIDRVRGYLKQLRYVVIFDDVWSTDLWTSIQHALTLNNCGSRIMLTTRNHELASYSVESPNHVYKLQPLSHKNAWRLFCKKAFRGECPPELQEWSLKLVNKCEGMPLAVVTIGGFLSTKNKIASEWKQFVDGMGYELENDPNLTPLTSILLLSYKDLPYRLKSCILYMSIFPEDYFVSYGRLIRCWIAEGFVKEIRGKTLEEVAHNQLNELIQRSLIQVAHLDLEGRIRSCRVHDILREIVLSKSEDENFCKVVMDHQNMTMGSPHENVRRLSIHNHSDNIPSNSSNVSHLRSFFMFRVVKVQEENFALGSFKLLRVLDLQGAPLQIVPEEIVNLFHLRYLSVRNTKIRNLPKSMGKLRNLQTLDLRKTYVDVLPIELLKLKQLRHLLALNINNNTDSLGVMVHKGIGCLTALQKLSFIEANTGDSCIIGELGNLTQLRKLGIRDLRRENGKDLCAAIEKMNDLRSLLVKSVYGEFLDIQSLSSPPKLLRRLYIDGHLEKLPDWIASLQNLVFLRMGWSRLRDDPIKVFQWMPNLVRLNLIEVYDAEQICFEAQGFKRLKELEISVLRRLKLLTLEEGAMPLLENMIIGACEQLKRVPLGIQHLRNLKYANFWNMSNEFESAALQILDYKEEVHHQLQHIMDVTFTSSCDDGSWFTYSREEFNSAMELVRMQSESQSSEDLFVSTKRTLLENLSNNRRYWYEQ